VRRAQQLAALLPAYLQCAEGFWTEGARSNDKNDLPNGRLDFRFEPMKTITSLFIAAALGGCASSSSDETASTGMFSNYSCVQLGALRGDRPNPKEHGKFKGDMDEIERASIEKGCHIDFR
jgi:hypothetical protein